MTGLLTLASFNPCVDCGDHFLLKGGDCTAMAASHLKSRDNASLPYCISQLSFTVMVRRSSSRRDSLSANSDYTRQSWGICQIKQMQQNLGFSTDRSPMICTGQAAYTCQRLAASTDYTPEGHSCITRSASAGVTCQRLPLDHP